MNILKYTCIVVLLLAAKFGTAEERIGYVAVFSDSASYNEFVMQQAQSVVKIKSPNPFFRKLFKPDASGKSRAVAAILAFPTTGITGVHRVYLGTAAYIPVVYVGTLGGCLGILPFVDFVVLLVDKDLSHYENNRKVFMWMK